MSLSHVLASSIALIELLSVRYLVDVFLLLSKCLRVLSLLRVAPKVTLHTFGATLFGLSALVIHLGVLSGMVAALAMTAFTVMDSCRDNCITG